MTATSGAAGFRRLAVLAGGIVVAIGCSGAVVAASARPAVRDGVASFVPQGMKLTGSGETGAGTLGGGFGDSVAVSADGSTAIVGGRRDNNLRGAAWVFVRTAAGWSQQGPKLTGAGEVGQGQFGLSVALSADGNTALVGGRADDGYKGAAWVFTRSASTWAQQGPKLTGSGEVGAGEFGWSVALSADGSTALIGGEIDDSRRGAAWVFSRAGNVWSQQGPKLTGAGEKGEGFFGYTVALSATGSTALIGGPYDGDGRGAVWALNRSGTSFSFQTKLTGLGSFGASVALSGDGYTALISEQSLDTPGAWVYRRLRDRLTRRLMGWSRVGGKLTGGGQDREVGGLALDSSGSTALLGTPHDVGGNGTLWAFARTGNAWSQQGGALTGAYEVGAGLLGQSAVLSANGSTAIAGGSLDDTGAGAAWVFVAPPIVSDVSPRSGPIIGGTTLTILGSGFTGVSAVRFGKSPAVSFTVVSPSKITAVSPPHLAAGTVEVTVSTAHGTSAASSASSFAYQRPKAVG